MCILFCFCLCKVRSRVSDALSQALCNLSLAFLADFTLSDSTDLIRFIAFSRKLHSAFQCSHVFHLTGTAALHSGHTFVGGILTVLLPMTNNRTRKERLSQVRTRWPLSTWSRFIRMRVFRGVKKWPTRHVAILTGNAQPSQQSIFRENHLKFPTFIRRWEG